MVFVYQIIQGMLDPINGLVVTLPGKPPPDDAIHGIRRLGMGP
jgi:hypothetical protein